MGFFVNGDTSNVSRREDLVLAAVDNKGAKTQHPGAMDFSPGFFIREMEIEDANGNEEDE